MQKTASERFSSLDHERSGLKSRLEAYSQLTLPYLMPDDNYNQKLDHLPTQFNSIGARGINHLANKMMLVLFNSPSPFYRYELDDKQKADLFELGLDESAISELLAQLEQSVYKEFNKVNLRPKLFEVLKQLICLGNSLLCLEDTESAEVVPFRNYVCKRSRKGTLLEGVIKRPTAYVELTDEVQEIYNRQVTKISDHNKDSCNVDLYEWIRLDGEYYIIEHWLDRIKLPDNYHKRVAKDELTSYFITWVLTDGADYGTGLVEENYGDLTAVDIASEAVSDGNIIASTHKWLVNNGSQMDVDEVKNSANGSVHVGAKDDLTLLVAPNVQNLRISLEVLQAYEKRIGQVFLLNSAVVRDAERVTTEEIRMQVQELDTSLGGAYTRLAHALQLPVAKFLVANSNGLVAKETKLTPIIVTGTDALNRSIEVERLNTFVSQAVQFVNLPEHILPYLKLDVIFNMLAAGAGIAKNAVVRTEQEVSQINQQKQQQAMQQQVAATAADTAAQAQAGEQA